MTPMLSYLWNFSNTVVPALADHLWQSTLFAAAAGLLTLVLGRLSARIRYIVWLAASVKFLVPFRFLVAIGSRLSPANGAIPTSGIYAIEQLAQPFTQPLSAIGAALPPTVNSTTELPGQAVLLIIWLVGTLVVMSAWLVRWWRVLATKRNSLVLSEGREAAALRHLETSMGTTGKIKVLLAPSSLEPGVFGIFHPVLLWPSSISERLDDPHLHAVLAHELCHVQRRDNFAACLHMLVESIFWFHPLVWWLGARLIEERERACDEAVIELGSARVVYAESILKICEFCSSSPLTCVSGVTGSDLKKRMVHIMTDRTVRKLDFTRKLLLWTAACLVLALPIIYGLFNPISGRADSEVGRAPKYVNVSIKPHLQEPNGASRVKIMISLMDASFTANAVSPQTLIQLAYHVQDTQLVGAPEWLGSAKYDIRARVDKTTADQLQKLPEDRRGAVGQQMLQGLLAEQFKLKVHQEARDLPVYELMVAEGGGELQKKTDESRGFMHLGMGELTSNGTPLELLATQLSMRLGRTVVDKTGLTGNYAYSLHWTPDADEQARMHRDAPELIAPQSSASNSSSPPLLTAIQEQLGLTLQPHIDRVQVLVIDHIEQATED
ncbi:MAG: TIGR03435 family protein [Acidobacteria bacterium]|nr:TIGR03435 family protein [Acidobacteriota bacterium]